MPNAARLVISDRVGYGEIHSVMALIFIPCEMASDHIWISSPACSPTMPAPRISPSRVGHDLDQAFCRAFGLGAVVFVVGPAVDIDLAVALAGGFLGEADIGEFRVGIGDPGDMPGIDLGRQAEQRAADDDAGVVVGDVRELQPAGDIADGEDASNSR